MARIITHKVEALPDIILMNDSTNPHPPNPTQAIAIKNPLTLIVLPPINNRTIIAPKAQRYNRTLTIEHMFCILVRRTIVCNTFVR